MQQQTTGHEPAGPVEPVEEFRHDTITHLQDCLAKAVELADGYATKGGAEREIARTHLDNAERYDGLAVEARRTVEEWRELVEITTRRRAALARPVEAPAAPELVAPVTPPEGFRAFQPAVADPTGAPCPVCGQPVFPGPNGPVHRIEGGTAAVCRLPVDDQNPTGVFPRIEAVL